MTRRAVSACLVSSGLAFTSPALLGQESQQPARDADVIFVSTPRPEDRALAEEVMRVDEGFRRAKLGADRAALERILSADYIGVNQTGNVRDKGKLLQLFDWFRIESLVDDSRAGPLQRKQRHRHGGTNRAQRNGQRPDAVHEGLREGTIGGMAPAGQHAVRDPRPLAQPVR